MRPIRAAIVSVLVTHATSMPTGSTLSDRERSGSACATPLLPLSLALLEASGGEELPGDDRGAEIGHEVPEESIDLVTREASGAEGISLNSYSTSGSAGSDRDSGVDRG